MKKISIQGIKGAFHEDAARTYFGEDIEVVECKTFKSAVQQVDEDKVDYVVMAIENSIAGSLLANYGLMREYHLRVVGEVYLHIQMNLMMLPGGELEDIKEVHSHPIALKQCAEFLYGTFGEIKLVESTDTAGAAKELLESQRSDVATIGNRRTAELYNLEIKEKGIETNKKNYTRFLILKKHGNPIEGTNKASICLECGHFHGALAQVLNIFAEHEINLTKIQSIPIVGRPTEYSFHIDLEFDSIDRYEKAIHRVLKCVSSLSILGEYQRGERP